MFYKITEMMTKQGKPYLKVESSATEQLDYLPIAQPIIEQYGKCTTRQQLLDLQAVYQQEQEQLRLEQERLSRESATIVEEQGETE